MNLTKNNDSKQDTYILKSCLEICSKFKPIFYLQILHEHAKSFPFLKSQNNKSQNPTWKSTITQIDFIWSIDQM